VSPTTANVTWGSMPTAVTEFSSSTRHRTKFDLSNSSQARIVVNVQNGGAPTASLCAQYSIDQVTWSYLDGSSGPCVTINLTGVRASAFVALAALAKTDVFLRVVGRNGSGQSPSFGQISIQVK
jgi:hypothetical protein